MRTMSDEVKAQKRFRKEWDEVCAMIRLNSTKEWREKVYLVPKSVEYTGIDYEKRYGKKG